VEDFLKSIEGRISVVTGAASGIGRSTAVALARAGSDVVLVDVNADGLEMACAEVERSGRRAFARRVDVADQGAVQELANLVEKDHGGAHVLVNNAGVSVAATFEEHTLEDFEWLMGINFWGVVYGCKLFLPQLKAKDEAHIVNISSLFGLIGVPMNSAYCASKFAVRGLSETLRAELADTSVGVTCVHPGGIATNIVKSSRFKEPEGLSGLRQKAERAFERMLSPDVVASRIVRAIRRNSARVLVARETHVLDALKRVAPVLTSEVVARRWRSTAHNY
jgi:NAD(P)-dependent dehydrogenase (short-subunit alcohol dehydrogenase family)